MTTETENIPEIPPGTPSPTKEEISTKAIVDAMTPLVRESIIQTRGAVLSGVQTAVSEIEHAKQGSRNFAETAPKKLSNPMNSNKAIGGLIGTLAVAASVFATTGDWKQALPFLLMGSGGSGLTWLIPNQPK